MREKLFLQLINILENNGIRYAILGNTEAYPKNIESDVDVIIHPDDIQCFHRVLWKIESDNIQIVQMLQHEIVAFYYVVVQVSDTEVTMVQPDVCTDYYRNGKRFLLASEMLNGTEIACDSRGRSKGFRVLSPEKEFIYYLLKKIEKGALSEYQFAHLLDRFLKNFEGALAYSGRFWSEKSIKVIQQAFEQNKPSLLQEHLFVLRRELQGVLELSARDMLKRFVLSVSRCFHPTGFVVHLCGDAEHTSAIGSGIVDLLEGAFRRKSVIDLSALRMVDRLVLPCRIWKARICSTLVILLGNRTPWFTPINAKVINEESIVRLVVSKTPECIIDEGTEEKIVFHLTEIFLDALSARTRRRCRHFNRSVNRDETCLIT